ncbi:MAG: ribonucleoside-diphosphate reductase, adenosylcobalamin-dependent [Cenarchaeum symbiont of Oopsacas minuta]|nr:ribonucleoside-diphosphate reductase, adenosylcobalamin-dependent [Cenarchaeum symbiont of Oopsacas minuta]
MDRISTIETNIDSIKKRSGSMVSFSLVQVSSAIYKALSATGNSDRTLADKISKAVLNKLAKHGFSSSHAPTVEDIQDMVESTLIELDHSEAAKAFILYRHERRKIREAKMKVLNSTTLDYVAKTFDINCLKILASRYLLRNNKGEITESPEQMFRRVAILITIGDILYDSKVFDSVGNIKQDTNVAESYYAKLDSFDFKFKIGEQYLNKYHFRSLIGHYITLAKNGNIKVGFKQLLTMLVAKKFDSYATKIDEYTKMMTMQNFLPNSPTMMNAGARLGQLSACFVLDMQDDMAKIMKSTTDAALIFKSGGGVGINYSSLRQEGDIVASTSGVASGPVSFMNIINTVTEVVKQGGKRRGANMGIMDVWHPDIESFITHKTEPGNLENFNVSIGIWEDFWKALTDSKDGKYMLRSARDQTPVREINAHQLMDVIAMSAWKSAEPGLIFFDQINKYNVFAKARGGPIRATNPCGEQSLYPYESCNLGSINIANLVKHTADGQYKFDWQGYEEIIRKTTKYLDNVIDVNLYPVDDIDRASKESRRIGLGVMGVADLLYKLRIPYNSKQGYDLQSKLAEALTYYSMEESVALAKTRGAFPLCSKTEYAEGKIPVAGYYETPKDQHSYDWDALIEKIKIHGIRNVLTTTVAPTGTLSMIADCANGMEPTFALVFEKRVTVGRFFYTNKIIEQILKDENIYSDEILEKIADNYGSMRGIDEIPTWMQNIYVTAMDIHWSDHLMAQAVWQKWIGNAIAKTINMPYDVTTEDVKAAYLLAHELGLKGITVYRDGSRHKQVLHMTSDKAQKTFDVKPSEHTKEFVQSNIHNEYIKTHIITALNTTIPNDPILEPTPMTETIPEDSLCPTCKNILIFSEGCSTCIECGHSGCTSG